MGKVGHYFYNDQRDKMKQVFFGGGEGKIESN